MSINGISASQPATPDRLSSLEPKIFNRVVNFLDYYSFASMSGLNKFWNNKVQIGFSNITRQTFKSNRSDANFLKKIALTKNVSYLKFDSCPNIKGACFASLKNLESLNTLDLSNLSIDENGIRVLAEAIRGKKITNYTLHDIKIPTGIGVLEFIDNISKDVEVFNTSNTFNSSSSRGLALLIAKLPFYKNLKEFGLNNAPTLLEAYSGLLAVNLPKTLERLYLTQVVLTENVLDTLTFRGPFENLTECNLHFNAPSQSIEALLKKMPLAQMNKICFGNIKIDNLLYISNETSKNKKIFYLRLNITNEMTENRFHLPILFNLLGSLRSEKLTLLSIKGFTTLSSAARLEIIRVVKENLRFWPNIKDLNVCGVTLEDCLAPTLPPPLAHQQLLRSGQPIAPVVNLQQLRPAAAANPVVAPVNSGQQMLAPQQVISMGRILQPQPLAAGRPEAAPIMGGFLANLVQAARIASGRPSSVISEIEPGDLVQRQQQMANRRAELRDK